MKTQTKMFFHSLSNISGKFFKKFPGELERKTKEWAEHENLWVQRTAILTQLSYKKETDVPLLFSLILTANDSKNSNDFFIRKAIGNKVQHQSLLINSSLFSRLEFEKLVQSLS